jgi:hypothetical protein
MPSDSTTAINGGDKRSLSTLRTMGERDIGADCTLESNCGCRDTPALPHGVPTSLSLDSFWEKHDADPFLAVRVVLLIATGISAFTMPWMVSCFLALCWILVMVWPKNR